MPKARRNDNRGITLVELIVCFALLAVFLATSAMCISHAIIFYYHEKQEMAAYSVADMVLSEIKDDIRTMQSSEFNGYVKIRAHDDGSGTMKAVSEIGGSYTGGCIEFVTSNVQDSPVAVQIDTEGCGDVAGDSLFKDAVLINKDGVINPSIKNIDPEYLTLRYYNKYPEKDLPEEYRDRYMDMILQNSTASKESKFSSYATAEGTKAVWHAMEKLSKASYMDFTVRLEFSVTPEDVVLNEGTPEEEHKELVRSVDVAVTVIDPSGDEKYTKYRSIDLANTVYYNNADTMYSDIWVNR